jgi:ABC-type phosphate transport system ATPase subunit
LVLRRRIATVFQQLPIIDDSVYRNVAWACVCALAM